MPRKCRETRAGVSRPWRQKKARIAKAEHISLLILAASTKVTIRQRLGFGIAHEQHAWRHQPPVDCPAPRNFAECATAEAKSSSREISQPSNVIVSNGS